MIFTKFHYYFYTLKSLKVSQIFYRVKYLFKNKFSAFFIKRTINKINKNIVSLGTPNFDIDFLKMRRKYYYGNVDNILKYDFTFLNNTKSFENAIKWHTEVTPELRLWYFNLHYHEYFIDIAEEFLKSKDQKYLNFLCNGIYNWIEENPINHKYSSYAAWNSYVISIRIVSWIKIMQLLEDFLPKNLNEAMLESLKKQTLKLNYNLELDILGNHLIKNWKALVFAAILYDNDKLLKKANLLFTKHIKTQFAESGVHEELTPMYTGIILEDLLEVHSIDNKLVKEELISKLFNSLKSMVFNEQDYSFFNDSVLNNGVKFKDLQRLYEIYFDNSNENSVLKNYSGMCIFKNNDFHMIIDAASMGLGHQLGHSHCDMLSFELCHKGKKLFTNTGTYEYIYTNRRKYLKSAASHNTLKPVNSDQAEVWHSFRIARKSKIFLKKFQEVNNGFEFEAKIHGFYPQKGSHERKITLENNLLTIDDLWDGSENAEVFFHLNPEFKFYKKNDNELFIIDKNNKNIGLFKCSSDNIKVINTEYYPELGKIEQKSTLIIKNIEPKNYVTSIINLF